MGLRLRRVAAVVAAAGAVVVATGCSRGGDERSEGRAGATTTVKSGVYVAIGASETAGIGADDPAGQAWPTVLHGKAMPGATYANLGIPGITVAEALAQELPEALKLGPTVVTIWLNVNDILRLVPLADYERDLAALVRPLRRGGSTTVLVANTPALDNLPAYRACLAGAPPGLPPCLAGRPLPGPQLVNAVVDAYNAAIERVVRAEGAHLVDLHAAGLAARVEGVEATLVSSDGFHPSTTGHRLVAEVFAATLGALPR